MADVSSATTVTTNIPVHLTDVTLKMLSTVRWALIAALFALTSAQDNPSILEDSRVHPTVDGSFGFLYRTQDGIAHAAKGDPGGAVHGRFTYTDPTGLKVNFNYNAGAQAIKQKQADQPQYQPAPQPQYRPPPPAQQSQDQGRYTQAQYEQDYEQPAYEQQPRYRPAPAPAPRNYAPAPQQYRPRQAQRNDIYDNDYNDPRYNRP
ncbi:Cuticular protein 100A [Carabus blaptoides fortunei]